MQWARTVQQLPVWPGVQAELPSLRGEKSQAAQDLIGGGTPVAGGASALHDLFATVLLPLVPGQAVDQAKVVVYTVLSQATSGAGEGSQVVLEATLLSGSVSGAPSASKARRLLVDVPGYDVEQGGRFAQVAASASGRGLLLLAPRCCVAVVAPPLVEAPVEEEGEPLRAVPLFPLEDTAFVKASWHPLSDAHVGLLLDDRSFLLVDLSKRAAASEPEVRLQVSFGSEAPDTAVDFVFCAPWASGPLARCGPLEAVWLAASVVFMSSRGKVSAFSPVLPSIAVFPSALLEAVSACAMGCGEAGATLAARDWLGQTVLRAENRREAAAGFETVRHQLHLLGHSEVYLQRWTPLEQVFSEERPDSADLSPRSPRHARSCYSSVLLAAHAPALIVARATASGLVEVLVASSALRPEFEHPTGAAPRRPLLRECAALEEIDLCVAASATRLAAFPSEAAGPVILVRTRSLLAAISLPWLSTLAHGGAGAPVEGLELSAVSTILELKTTEGSEILGLQLLRLPTFAPPCLLLCASSLAAAEGAKPTMQAVDIAAVLCAAAKAKPQAKDGVKEAEAAAGDRDEYLRHLEAPVLLPKPLFGAVASGSAAEVAKAVASVHGGQLANLAMRKQVLAHLTAQIPARAEEARRQLADARRRAEALRDTHVKSAATMERLQEEQKRLQERHDRVVAALADKVRVRELDHVAEEELPGLWAQLHELRRAFELLRAAAVSAPQPRQASAALGAQFVPSDLLTLERLHRTWTDASAGRLRERVEAVDAALAAAKPPTGRAHC